MRIRISFLPVRERIKDFNEGRKVSFV